MRERLISEYEASEHRKYCEVYIIYLRLRERETEKEGGMRKQAGPRGGARFTGTRPLSLALRVSVQAREQAQRQRVSQSVDDVRQVKLADI